MLADATHPELVVKERSARHDAGGELCVTGGAGGGPVRYGCLTAGTLGLLYSGVLGTVTGEDL